MGNRVETGPPRSGKRGGLPHRGLIVETISPAITNLPMNRRIPDQVRRAGTTPKGRKVEASKAKMLHGINGDHPEIGIVKNVGGIPRIETQTRVRSVMVATQ